MRSLAGLAVLVALAAPAHAERPRLERVLVHVDPAKVPAVVNSKIIFLNRCANGCKVSFGDTDSRTDKSGIGQGTLSAFSYGDSSWNGVVACMKDVFDPFNVVITDQDPGPNVEHFEIMIAGTPGQLGLPSGVGGIAEYGCSAPGVCAKFLPNALVFDFAGVWGNDVEEICATAAQEIAHTWTLDHVTDASDPMTYNPYSGRRQFKDGVFCGSDCVNGQSPFGLTCSGNQHTCMSTGTATQDDIKITTALFGPAGAKEPTLDVKNPLDGSAQAPGFTIDVECTSPDGIQEVDISIDGIPRATLKTTPYTYTTPTNLTEGPHQVKVLCATNLQAIAIATPTVLIGQPCDNGACATAGYVCFDGACIAGPESPGGVGATCTTNADCIGGSCASDGTQNTCVIPCDLDAPNCPDGFGCLEAGSAGVCWIGADDDGGGCCDTSGGGGAGSMLLALGIAATFVTRKRRR